MNIQAFTPGLGPAVRLLKALANERRLMILCALGEGERSVGDLAARVGLGQSALSQHLAKLREDGLVVTRRCAQTIFYSLASREAAEVIAVLAGLYCPADTHTTDGDFPP
ncbi:winged helix-turn-helix transcriptional regulator [Azospirillum sp. RWY-5-1]|uniref:Winged helix-turn-helix transcriptional regulator n=1 Tax=Azospirillum oleiclasticum TaxID=2735135 RepID=A0ABX2TLN3_9PROT|nr:metalloregulator ArsR/SmtB family transcription factor [Azospirillum oleiclasticum]NYZ16478.1 winged helix-turn-helix transcriptional regulator [Azospirillum oleiclasticum]NYZ24053.1 winged helix-turn-helix transcriptional regulator [Azospirillum oleiclasticum]